MCLILIVSNTPKNGDLNDGVIIFGYQNIDVQKKKWSDPVTKWYEEMRNNHGKQNQ